MIEVTYYREHNRLTVKGHARSAEPGRDLICAACSILALTMAASLFALLPAVLIFAFGQKYLEQGILAGAVKG